MNKSSPAEVVTGFTEDQACRLSGVSRRQLRYWASDGFFRPSIDLSDQGLHSLRLYSFRDVVCLRILNSLRNDARIPLQHLREVKDRLSHLGDALWAKTTLHVLGRRVVFDNPETGGKEDVTSGQGVLRIPLVVVSGNMEEAVRAMRARPACDHGKIDLETAGSRRPLIAGTRISVQAIKDFDDAGYGTAEIIEQYPSLTEADVAAAIGFSAAA